MAPLSQSFVVPRGAVVPGRVARVLLTDGRLSTFAATVRGKDAEVDAVLGALLAEALAWSRATRSRHGLSADPPATPPSAHMSTTEAARLAGVSVRTLQRDIAEGRLPAQRVGGRFVVDVEDVESYRAARAA